VKDGLNAIIALMIAGVIVAFCFVFAFAAEPPKSMEQLLADRAGVKAAIAAVEKQFQVNQAEFDKTDVAAKHIAKQNELRKAHNDATTKLKDLDSAIVEKVTAEKKK
jgi:hypothetical protein